MLQEDFELILSSGIQWSAFANKTIFITGANGFLPAYMVESLLHLNETLLRETPCRVIILARNKQYCESRFTSYLQNRALKILFQDVVQKIEIDEKIDFIIHAASLASPKYYSLDPVGVILPNILGTKNTLELAIQKRVQGYLYFSSAEVYGEVEEDAIIDENGYGFLDPTSLRACYGESKRMGENLCVSYGHQFDVPVKIVRPFHTYGAGMKLDDGRVFADFVKNIVHNENIELKSDGSTVRSFCYLADATVAFFKVLLEGKNANAYNVANPHATLSIRDLAQTLVDMYPQKNLKAIFAQQSDTYLQSPNRGNTIDIAKIKALGWEPKISIIEGFERTIRSYECI